MRVYISIAVVVVKKNHYVIHFSSSRLVQCVPPPLKLGCNLSHAAGSLGEGSTHPLHAVRMPCQRADALRLGVPQELCGAELQPMLTQLGRDMQYWQPRSITPAMLDEIRAVKQDDPVRVALMIVNRTVWYLRPLGTQRSPMVIALVHDLQA